MRIREAAVEDVPEIFEMLRASAADQGQPDAVVVTEQDLREDGFGDCPKFYALMAENGAAAGFALYYFNYSTWTSRFGLYLEDLYVRPEYRGTGLASDMMRRLARIAVESRCGRFHWLVLRDNRRAVRFYEKLGAELFGEWVPTYLTGEALAALAREAVETD